MNAVVGISDCLHIEESDLISCDEAAKLLNIRILSLGQLVFEEKIRPKGIKFYRKDIENLIGVDLSSYRT